METKKKIRRNTGRAQPVAADPTAARKERSRAFKAFAWGLVILAGVGIAFALFAPTRAEKGAPPGPAHFFNDYAQLVSPQFANGKDFWIKISPRAQFVTVIYPRSPEGSVDEFTTRAARSWEIGQAGANNGLILFVFRDERTLRLEVGYGLEPTVTDLDSRRILANVIAPFLARGDYEGGLDAGTEAILEILKGADDVDPVGRNASIWRAFKSGVHVLPEAVRSGWARFLAEGTEGRIAISIFAAVFFAVLIGATVPLIESLPSFVLLPWRLWKSPTLRTLNGTELRQQFGLREFFRRPPPVFGALGGDVCFGDMLGGLIGAVRLLTLVLLLLTGLSVMSGGLGHFGGAGATVQWRER